ncbi:unnamed protein product [Cunninghamella blakesleeana]
MDDVADLVVLSAVAVVIATTHHNLTQYQNEAIRDVCTKFTLPSPQPSSANTVEASNNNISNNTSSYHSFNSQPMSNFLNPTPPTTGNDLIITKLEQMLVEINQLIKNLESYRLLYYHQIMIYI